MNSKQYSNVVSLDKIAMKPWFLIIYKSIFLTSIFFVSLVFATAKFLGSDFWYRLTNVRMDYLALFEDFVFSLIVDVLGVFIAIFFLMLFIKDVKKSDNPVEMIKNKINETKKQIYFTLILILVCFVVGLFVEIVGIYNMVFIPTILIFALTAFVFFALLENYALK